jgi:hypothetical protein
MSNMVEDGETAIEYLERNGTTTVWMDLLDNICDGKKSIQDVVSGPIILKKRIEFL